MYGLKPEAWFLFGFTPRDFSRWTNAHVKLKYFNSKSMPQMSLILFLIDHHKANMTGQKSSAIHWHISDYIWKKSEELLRYKEVLLTVILTVSICSEVESCSVLGVTSGIQMEPAWVISMKVLPLVLKGCLLPLQLCWLSWEVCVSVCVYTHVRVSVYIHDMPTTTYIHCRTDSLK